MKRLLSALVCMLILVLSFAGLTACGTQTEKGGKVTFYMPDGATALAAAKLMSEENKFERELSYKVVDASLISGFVTGENPQADLCILPLNLASKLLGSGEKYKMLGTVTHGNLFILKKPGGEDITSDNITLLKGKTVGVIQLSNVPGLIFKTVLADKGLQYAETGNNGSVDENKINLKAVAPEAVIPSDGTCDYFVVPEPAASTKVNATKGALSFAGSLQTLYGSENGYPQAVLVAKKSLIESSPAFISQLTASMRESAKWLLEETTSPEIIIDAVKSHLTEGLNPSFTATNLNKTVIRNCAVNFVDSDACKEEVNLFLGKLIAVNPSAAQTVPEEFYYTAKKL